MTVSDFFEAFTRFGGDVAFVALVVAVGVRVLKSVVFKDRSWHPALSFLPFGLGLFFCAVWLCCVRSPAVLWEDVGFVLRRGFAAGGLSVLLSALLSRLRGKKALSPAAAVVRELLDGFSSGAALDELAVRVAEAVSREYSEEDVARVRGLLQKCAPIGYDPAALTALAELIVRTLRAYVQ